jgi:hypothetical protein
MSMYNNDDIMSKMTEQAWLIEQLESTVTNLVSQIGDLTEQIELMPYKDKVEPIEMPEFEGTDNALENLTIRKNV